MPVRTSQVISGRSPKPDWSSPEYYSPMPTSARNVFPTSVVDGRIYAVGGSGVGVLLSTVEEYDPVTDEWTVKTSMPAGRFAHSASVVDGVIYVIGGTVTWPEMDGLSTVEAYNPALDPLETSIQALFWGALKAMFR